MPASSGGDKGGLRALLDRLFVTTANKIRWEDLGGALIGAVLFRLLAAIVAIPLGVGTAFLEFAGAIITAIEKGVDKFTDTLVTQAGKTWDPFIGVGLGGSFLLNLLVLLATLYVAARAYEVIVNG